MDPEKLVFMANQIAGFFKAYPEEDAVIGVRDHIKSFWTPGMRRTLQTRLQGDASGLEHLVVVAMTQKRPEGESPIKKEVQGPGALGEMASDAG
jgi:formate dehydrogenase subunit delta